MIRFLFPVILIFIPVTIYSQEEKIQDSIYIPNVLSPNSETNDVFMPSGIKSAWELFVLNRWGEKIFQGKNEGWNGMFKDSPVASDVYFYQITYMDEGKEVKLTGHVTVIR
ncbi:MAG: gliding motility-associated C-terminal domain-containing protein [Bacteroidota bacterium]